MLKKGKIAIYTIWILIIISLIAASIWRPELLSPEYISGYIQKFQTEMLLVYILLSLLRGLFLIPSTPFVLAGALLFPEKPFWVLCISMTGIMLSATVLYYFSDYLGFSKFLDKKYASKVDRLRSRFTSSNTIYLAAGWSLLPVVPTDFICYAGGILKVPFKNIFIGVFIGELILCSLYIYFGAHIFDWL